MSKAVKCTVVALSLFALSASSALLVTPEGSMRAWFITVSIVSLLGSIAVGIVAFVGGFLVE